MTLRKVEEKKTKAKHTFGYDGEWYLETGYIYINFGENIKNEEVNDKVKCEELQKIKLRT